MVAGSTDEFSNSCVEGGGGGEKKTKFRIKLNSGKKSKKDHVKPTESETIKNLNKRIVKGFRIAWKPILVNFFNVITGERIGRQAS